MSDEIIDVNAEEIVGPSETKTEKGMNIPDPEMIDELDADGLSALEQAREATAALPEYPKEWQDYSDEDTGFDTEKSPNVTATLKQNEINKLIKKYKRYMKSNFKELRRLSK